MAEFLSLVHTLLNELSPSEAVNDNVLIQLHALFGPMLASALQLVDRREVVRVLLPGGRTIYQVTSSHGAPYTLYLDIPEKDTVVDAGAGVDGPDQSSENEVKRGERGRAPETAPGPEPGQVPDQEPETSAESPEHDAPLQSRHDATQAAITKLGRMFCPCPGFAYNSLTGDRNVFCKHVLAVILAHRLGRILQTEVGLPAVADLVGATQYA